jgi:hypothetical protein
MRRQSSLRLWHLSVSWLLLSLAGCGAHGFVPTQGGAGAQTQADAALEREALRAKNLHTRLHPGALALISSQGREASWVRDAVVKLPAESCAAAVRVAPTLGAECTLLALDQGSVALLVLREGACGPQVCAEHSWVFLGAYEAPLALPSLRTADYHALRAELPSDTAAVLWLAGFRGTSPTRLAERGREHAAPYGPLAHNQYGDEPELPALADYASCTFAPDQRELLCRSHAGDVLGIDAVTGATRVVAELGLSESDLYGEPGALAHAPVSFTREGQLVVRVEAQHDPRCGQGPCELVSFLDWPITKAEHVELMRAD